jgi:hypothetical protein
LRDRFVHRSLPFLEQLNFPTFVFDIREAPEGRQVFDVVRRRYVRLTPEEWVRQHVVRFLIEHRGFPRGLVAIEPGFTLRQLPKRADVVAYQRDGTPLLVVECKATTVPIGQAAVDQAARYNSVLGAAYVLVTNGRKHLFWHAEPVDGAFRFLADIPAFDHLVALHSADPEGDDELAE